MESNQEKMKLQCSVLLIVLLALTATSCYKRPFAAEVPQTEAVQEGQVLYMQYCQKCHPDGEAGLGPSIYYVPGFAKRFQVRHGVGSMPDFDESVISDDELDKIILYLKTLDDNE